MWGNVWGGMGGHPKNTTKTKEKGVEKTYDLLKILKINTHLQNELYTSGQTRVKICNFPFGK